MKQLSLQLKPTDADLERVTSRIAKAIMEFIEVAQRRKFSTITNDDGHFYADDLREHVTARVGTIAPGSADRILRLLRKRGIVNYRVVSRSQSLYEVIE